MVVFPRNRHYDSSSAAQQMWSDWSWCIYPGRSTTKHSGTFACPAQFGTRLLANLISIDPLKKASSSGGNKKTNSYTKKISLGFILTTSSSPPSNQPMISQALLLCKAALRPGLWDYKRPCVNVKKKNIPILISTSPSHQDMVWTSRFCPVNLSNITNYSVQTLIETTPWKSEGNWCAAVRQSWTVAPRQFLAHDSCKSEVNLSNQPLCTTSVTQNTTLEFVLSSYWVASI